MDDAYPDDPLDGAAVHAVYQPIVDLRTTQVVACEALTRGAAGSRWERPDDLFAAARRAGNARLQQLDEVCLHAALSGVHGLRGIGTLFLNAEPDTIGALSSQQLAELDTLVPPGLEVVVEVTERALLQRPAQLLAGVRRTRALGWGVAVDDVGADPAALALMPFLAPHVIKLDLSLVRSRPTLEVAAIVHAVHAEAERSGAVVLAEGIETEQHLDRALSLGAQLGQGWLFGRPVRPPGPTTATLRLPAHALPRQARTPFTLLTRDTAPQRIALPLLAALSRQVERQALLLDELAVVAANFEHVRHFTGSTRRRYASVAAASALTAVLAPGMPDEPAPGVRGSAVDPADPLTDEWVVTVVGPHHAVALAARRVGAYDGGVPLLDYVLTYDRAKVLQAAGLLLERVQPREQTTVAAPPASSAPSLAAADLPGLLLRAAGTAVNGITIADAQVPDLPLVYANEAFLRMTGYTAQEVLGRNCRLLQGPETDRIQGRVIARRLAAGQEVRTVLLNYRKDGSTFWNELTISPVTDDRGTVTHFIGNQLDVSTAVEREELALALADRDDLTGLPNRRRLREHLTGVLARAHREGSPVHVLLLRLHGLSAVNAAEGRSGGDAALAATCQRMAAAVRAGDLLARLDGSELVLVPSSDTSAREVEQSLRAAAHPLDLRAGAARFPEDGATPDALLDAAARRVHRGG